MDKKPDYIIINNLVELKEEWKSNWSEPDLYLWLGGKKKYLRKHKIGKCPVIFIDKPLIK